MSPNSIKCFIKVKQHITTSALELNKMQQIQCSFTDRNMTEIHWCLYNPRLPGGSGFVRFCCWGSTLVANYGGVKPSSTINQIKPPDVITEQLPLSLSGSGQPFHNMWFALLQSCLRLLNKIHLWQRAVTVAITIVSNVNTMGSPAAKEGSHCYVRARLSASVAGVDNCWTFPGSRCVLAMWPWQPKEAHRGKC